MKVWLGVLLCITGLFGEIYLIDGTAKIPLISVSSPKLEQISQASIPHITREHATLTLQFEGKDYNHRHLNVRLATLEEHPEHTVLTEYSETIQSNVHRITFSDYHIVGPRMLQVYYRGAWYVGQLEALEDHSAQQSNHTTENTTPDDQPSKVLSYEALDHLLDQLRR